MNVGYDCIPCIIRQTIDTSRLSIEDPDKQRSVINKVLHYIQNVEFNISPPEFGKRIYAIIAEETGNSDPYKEHKIKHNQMAMDLYDKIKKTVYLSNDPVFMAAKLAIAANIIDFGSPGHKVINMQKMLDEIDQMHFTVNDFHKFVDDFVHAKNVLYLADNAGELVFDKLFIEVLKRFYPERGNNFIVVVRGAPVINDATMEDVRMIGLDSVVKVIENGDNAPATVLNSVSKETKAIFENADIIISKGQGNYETLHEQKKLIYFLFKVKCPVIAEMLKLPEGSMLFQRNLEYGS